MTHEHDRTMLIHPYVLYAVFALYAIATVDALVQRDWYDVAFYPLMAVLMWLGRLPWKSSTVAERTAAVVVIVVLFAGMAMRTAMRTGG